MDDYLDISPEISADTAVFPGDTAFRMTPILDFAQGHHLLLSRIETTPHIGAHADAPNHYHPEGRGIAERSLTYYHGDCQVMRVDAPRGARLLPQNLAGKPVLAPRLLLHTGSFPDPNRWNDDFNSLSPELVDDLAARGVMLIGIDTPSVDPSDAKILAAHHAIHRHDLAILEGLVLTHVPEGVYHLTALPLRIRGADASPVRAVLWKK